jgi:uncharacterized membrane protein
MSESLKYWIILAWNVLGYSHRLIIWNLFLAFIPLVLSIWLFRLSKLQLLLWIVLFLY